MIQYQKLVIKHLQQIGKSYWFALWATNQLDMDDYATKYFPQEMAELIIEMQWMLEEGLVQ